MTPVGSKGYSTSLPKNEPTDSSNTWVQAQLSLNYRTSGGQTKANIPQELVNPAPICQKESFALPVAEGAYASTDIHLWLCIKAHASFQAPSAFQSPHASLLALPPATPPPYNYSHQLYLFSRSLHSSLLLPSPGNVQSTSFSLCSTPPDALGSFPLISTVKTLTVQWSSHAGSFLTAPPSNKHL